MEVNVGAKVVTRDGKMAGEVDRVIMIPDKNQLISIVVHKGFFLTRDIVVHAQDIERADKHAVYLRITAKELDNMPDFVPENYTVPPRHWTPPSIYVPAHVLVPVPGYVDISKTREELETKAQEAQIGERIPRGAVELNEGTEVDCIDGRLGTIDEILIDSRSKQVTGIVVRMGTILTKDVVVPVRRIAEIRSDRVLLNCKKAQVEHPTNELRR